MDQPGTSKQGQNSEPEQQASGSQQKPAPENKSDTDKGFSVSFPATTRKKKDEEFEFMMFMEKSDKRKMEEQHAARMHELRKSLDYIKQTEWMYEPIDKLLGEKK